MSKSTTAKLVLIALIFGFAVFGLGFYLGRSSNLLSHLLAHPAQMPFDFSQIFNQSQSESDSSSTKVTPEPVITIIEEEYVNPFDLVE